MTRWALGIEYDGSAYCGWQIQNNGLSVQAVVEASLSRIADHPITTKCAGRTDAGVHAIGQVVHFDTTAKRSDQAWVLGANTHLPNDVCIAWAMIVPDEFHARFSATSRSYRYLILNRPVRSALAAERYVWIYKNLDAKRMHSAAQQLVGEHDFSSFRASDCQAKTAVRTISEVNVSRHDELIVLSVTANAFLKHMVRNIAGVLLDVGSEDRDAGWVRTVLDSRDRREGGVTAPPEGLYLVSVRYPEKFGLPKPPDLSTVIVS